MKVYNVSTARARLGDVLDAAEAGEPVYIERRGVRLAVTLEPAVARRPGKRPRIEIVDAGVESGNWSWDWKGSGLRFRPRGRA
jgi:antitoxin (DNA-binding transcriptional repressor) of toxin-antitoxin stability system